MIKQGTNPYFVKELETGYVAIGDNQHFYGYTLFLYKKHGNKTEIFHLEKDEQAKFLEEMTIVAKAIKESFRNLSFSISICFSITFISINYNLLS